MKGLALSRETIGADLVAGVVNAVTSIPDAMASGMLAGLNPIQGLYCLMVGTPVGALTTGSVFMNVSVTSAMALAVGDGLERYAERLQANGGTLMLSGVSKSTLELLQETETTDTIPEKNVFLADETLGSSTRRALEAAEEWRPRSEGTEGTE